MLKGALKNDEMRRPLNLGVRPWLFLIIITLGPSDDLLIAPLLPRKVRNILKCGEKLGMSKIDNISYRL